MKLVVAFVVTVGRVPCQIVEELGSELTAGCDVEPEFSSSHYANHHFLKIIFIDRGTKKFKTLVWHNEFQKIPKSKISLVL